MNHKGKIIVLSAPSGCGKSTIIKELMKDPSLKLGFSISCTSRAPRGEEKHGKEYYFISDEEFLRKIENGEFVEWEEVYSGTHYGTLYSEVDRVTGEGNNLIMDIDVKGGRSIKEKYGDKAIAIFIMPPSTEELERRLRTRATDDEATIKKRLAKAEYEMGFAPEYDVTIVNDELQIAVQNVKETIKSFLDR